MAVEVVRAYLIVDGVIFLPKRLSGGRAGSIVGVLANLREHPSRDGPIFNLSITLTVKGQEHTTDMPLERFLSAEEYKESFDSPLCFEDFEATRVSTTEMPKANLSWLWLFRDVIYSAARTPRGREVEEVILRIKALHFQEDDALKRLREQVANFEAVEENSKSSKSRKPITDDVKLFAWSRDGGACVKCGATSDLHFDHIIPLSRGGGDHAENIQLLCRTCNLTKSDHLA